MHTCLVTGGTGFIGPRLVAVLQAAGAEVRCLVRRGSDTSRLEPLGVQLAWGDVTDRASLAPAVADADFVFHLAGRTFAPRYEQFAQVNAGGCENVAAACDAQTTPPVLVVVSSLAAAGPSPPGGAVTERDPPDPISDYGRSKLAGELAARAWAGRLPLSIVRPPAVFGPGDRAGLTLARSISRTGLHVVHRPGLPLSLVHVDDLVDALLLVAERGERIDPTDPRGTGVYHAADPQPSSYTAMGQMIAEAVGRRLRVVKVRRWALATAAVASEAISRFRGTTPVLNLDKVREGTATGWVTSTDKLVAQFHFAPAAPLAERYRQTVEWYQRENWL